MSYVEFSELVGKTITAIAGLESDSESVEITTADGSRFEMYHSQDCCEYVRVADVCGDIADIIGSPVLLAEESTSDEHPEGYVAGYEDSFTWTFYRLATTKGFVVIRWLGSSNGYYSESVSIRWLKRCAA